MKKAIDAFSLSSHVQEHQSRIGYVDALWHLRAASAVVILGSTQTHYTPSKVYQAVQSGNPVLALVPDKSGAAEVLRSSGRGFVVNYPDHKSTVTDGIVRALSKILNGWHGSQSTGIESTELCAARAGARRLAESLTRACRH